jgi:hypothetical protein
MEITAYILSCPERELARRQTLENLQATDWLAQPEIEVDNSNYERRQERQERAACRLLHRAIANAPEFILFLEDDLQFNQHLRHNLEHWHPLRQANANDHYFGSLYNPTIRELTRDSNRAFFVADPECVYGSQAFVFSKATARYMAMHWDEVSGMQDIKMSRLAARVCPIYYHTPSLVQHVGVNSVWGGHFHWANDFHSAWKAGA